MQIPLLSAIVLIGVLCTVPACASESISFKWERGEFAGERDTRVALLVPAMVGGKPCSLQLDSGMGSAVKWHLEDPSPEVPPQSIRVSFAGIERDVPVPKVVREHLGNDGPCSGVVGSLGNAFFEHGTLTLDLHRARLRFNAGSTLTGQNVAQPMLYRRGRVHGDHLFVEVRAVGGALRHGMLDTGASAIGMGALKAADWAALTGNAPLARTDLVQTFSIQSWGRELACYRTAASGDFRIGAGQRKTLKITHCPELGFEPDREVIGIIGLQSFERATMTLDYVAGLWLVTD